MKPQITNSPGDHSKLRPRPTANDYDQKAFLAYVKKQYVEKPKAAGKPKPGIPFPVLEWVLEVAFRAPRSKVGRPRKIPKMTLEAMVEDLAQERAELIAEGRKANPPKLPTGGQVWEVTRRKAAETGYAEGYLDDLVKHPRRLRHPRSRKPKKTD
jgi:hypothetical protein